MMLNISACSNPTTTGRSNSFDLSEVPGSARSRIAKHSRRTHSIFSSNDVRPSLPLMTSEGLQTRVMFMGTEIERLKTTNAQLLTKMQSREAERINSRNTNMTFSSAQKHMKTSADQSHATFDLSSARSEAEAWKDKYMVMEQSYRNEIESLKSRLHASLAESGQKRTSLEVSPKIKGDAGTPRFRPTAIEFSAAKAEDQMHAIMKARIEEMYMENKRLEGQVDYYKGNFEAQKREVEMLRKQIAEFPQQRVISQEKETSVNQDDFVEMHEPIYMKALVFEDLNKICEKKKVLEAVKGDDAVSVNDSFTEERVELERSKIEVKKLQKDIARYEGIVSVLSKRVQEGAHTRTEKENIARELALYKQMAIDNEKRSMEMQERLEREKQVIKNIPSQIDQIEGNYKAEIVRLTGLLEEKKIILKAYDRENDRLQGSSTEVELLKVRVLELEGIIQRLNNDITACKQEYEALHNNPSVNDFKGKLEQSEKAVLELMKENSELSQSLKARMLEINELREGHQETLTSYREEVNQRWVTSCTQMEEMALTLQMKKDNMQAQLERMKTLLEANLSEMQELYEQNEEKEQENMALLEQLNTLRSKCS